MHLHQWKLGGSLGEAAGMDRVTWTTADPTRAIVDGLDTSLSFVQGAERWLYEEGSASYDGQDMIESTHRSGLEVTVNGPATVRFWWSVEAGLGREHRWSVNGVVLSVLNVRTNAEIGQWFQVSQVLPTGVHHLRWDAADDRLRLDKFELLPGGEIATLDWWVAMKGLSGGQAGPLMAPAGDGIPNLLKYAFGLEPMVSADGQTGAFLPRHQIRSSQFGDRLHLEFLRRKGSSCLLYTSPSPRD